MRRQRTFFQLVQDFLISLVSSKVSSSFKSKLTVSVRYIAQSLIEPIISSPQENYFQFSC